MELSTVAAAALAAAVVAAVSPYLARLTVSVPDRDDTSWWRARRPLSSSRRAVVAGVGLACGALAGASGGRHGWAAFVWLGLVMTPLVVIDVEHHRLPDRLVFAGLLGGTALLGVATVADGDGRALLRALAAAVVTFVVFCALTVTAGFGFGDTKLVTVLAGYLGWLGWGYAVCGVIGGFCVGALVSVPLLISGRATVTTPLPFGPALVVGALGVSAFGLVPAALT